MNHFNLKVSRFSCLYSMALTGLLILSCKDAGGFAGSGGTGKKEAAVVVAPKKQSESFSIAAAGNGKVDVAFFLDTSDSMKQEIASLLAGLQKFADQLSAGEEGIDYQMFIVASSSKISASFKDTAKLDIRNSEVNSHSGLWNAYHFLEGNTDKVPAGGLKLRTDAIKELVFLTDDDATAITANNFGPYLKSSTVKLGQVRVNGFVGLPTSASTSTCKVAAVGQSYISLGSDETIGGTIADVCNSDWDGLLTDLSEQVRGRAGRSTSVTLKAKPAANQLEVKVDGIAVTNFTYDATKGKVTIDPAKLTAGAHKVEVSY